MPMTSPRHLLMATAVISGQLTLQLWWLGLPDARRSATVRFPLQLHVLGTVFQGCAITSVVPELPEDTAFKTGDSVTLTLNGCI